MPAFNWRGIDIDQAAQMRPAQLPTQCVDNLLSLEYLSKAQHVAQILGAETAPVFYLQLSRQCRDNLLTIASAFALEHFGADALTNAPVKQRQSRIDSGGAQPWPRQSGGE